MSAIRAQLSAPKNCTRFRCDDGETWREHTTTYLQTSWQGGDEEIYADFVATTGITAAYQALDTSRIVRISCTTFPKYFAILSRVKEEVRAIGADGGKVVSSHEPHVQAFFPPGALQKKIKVALQAMENMGFNNDDGWLSDLLSKYDGDIGKVLDLINHAKPMRT